MVNYSSGMQRSLRLCKSAAFAKSVETVKGVNKITKTIATQKAAHSSVHPSFDDAMKRYTVSSVGKNADRFGFILSMKSE